VGAPKWLGAREIQIAKKLYRSNPGSPPRGVRQEPRSALRNAVRATEASSHRPLWSTPEEADCQSAAGCHAAPQSSL